MVELYVLWHLSVTKRLMNSIKFIEKKRDFLDDTVTEIDKTIIFEAIHNLLFQQIITKFKEVLSIVESKGLTVTLWV